MTNVYHIKFVFIDFVSVKVILKILAHIITNILIDRFGT